MSEQALYTDGGCIQRNPSSIGGTWAWVLVEDGRVFAEDGQIVASASGVIPANGTPVSNNVAELVAAVRGLEALPRGWSGRFCCDSQVTIGRLFWGYPFRGVPQELVERAQKAVRNLWIRPVLLQGHPTKADLERGIGVKRGLPVSKWNVAVDRMCQEEARKCLEGREEVKA